MNTGTAHTAEPAAANDSTAPGLPSAMPVDGAVDVHNLLSPDFEHLPETGMECINTGVAKPVPDEKAGGHNEEEVQRLAEAFRIFNQASEELSSAYSALQTQVEQLTGELAEANGKLRRQYEEKAHLTEKLTTLLNELPAAVVLLDRNGLVDQANPAATQLFGTQMLGSDWQKHAARLQATEAAHEMQCEAIGEQSDPLGALRRLSVNEVELASGEGRLVLLHDVTQAHELKAQAARNERLAAMGELAAGLAHQLRTPLAAALLYVGNLQNVAQVEDAERQRIAGRAVDRLKHLEQLIRDTLLFARGETLGRVPVNVQAMLKEVAGTIEPLAQQHRVQFEVEIPAQPDIQLVGDEKALAGAIANLLENALQAASAAALANAPQVAQVRLSAQCAEGLWRIKVCDSGRGIDPALQEKLFQPFFTTRSEGTGLGLAIARGVARAHGGDISVSSRQGEGSCFELRLPYIAPNVTSQEHAS